MKKKHIIITIFLTTYSSLAQIAIGTKIPDPSSALDLGFTDKGLLLTRVSLSATTDTTTINSPANSLVVYNTNTENDVTPGFYYWNISHLKWIRLVDSDLPNSNWSLSGNAGIEPGKNFIGTTDDIDLVFKRNNLQSGLIRPLSTAFGYVALGSATEDNYNSAFGARALTGNTTGKINVAVGSIALVLNKTGTGNTAIGAGALCYNTEGDFNTALGANSLINNTTGNANLALGYKALENNTQGSRNIAIGNYAGTSSDNLNNTIVIGSSDTSSNRATVYKNNTIQLGNRDHKEAYTHANIGIMSVPASETVLPSDTKARLHIQTTSETKDPLILENILTVNDPINTVDTNSTTYYNLKISDAGVVRKEIAPPSTVVVASIYDLDQTLTIASGNSSGGGGTLMPWRLNGELVGNNVITLKENGIYIFSFRFYGITPIGAKGDGMSFYVSALKNNSLFDIAEILVVKSSTGVATYTLNLTVSGVKGDNISFKIAYNDYETSNIIGWKLTGGKFGLNAAKTSMTYWKSN